MQSALVEEGEQHGLYYIIFVMCIGNLIAPQLLNRIVQCTFTHFRTKRTGIVLLAVFKYDLGNRSLHYGIWDISVRTKCTDFIQIQILKSKIDCDCNNCKMLRIKLAEFI